jgi:hypothetical protein
MSVLSENMNAGNLPAPNNKLLDGACDDDDNELTDVQKALIAERMKALQAGANTRPPFSST